MTDFTMRIDQNKYLADGSGEVNAIVTVEAGGGSASDAGGTGTNARSSGPARVIPESGAAAAEVVIIDTSGSMGWPRTKIDAAREAAAAAVDTLRDGVEFAVVSGSSGANMVYPKTVRTVPATVQTRAEAKASIAKLKAVGGTAMGSWLRLADQLLSPHRSKIRHAILLTDGRNQNETTEEFERTLAEVEGNFVCDSRGFGTDWEPNELRRVADALLGEVDIVGDPRLLADDFRAMTQNAMGKSIADVSLRVWIPANARLRFVKQVLPTVVDLTAKRRESGPQTGDYPIGAWGSESRDYHICVEVPAGNVGQEMRAAWVRLVAPSASGQGEEILASGNVLAEWTDDEGEYTTINPQVAHYTGQAELAEAIQEGLQAKKDGDVERATVRLGRAVALAAETGNESVRSLLDKVVDVDQGSGTVRLRRQVDKVDEMSLDTRSTRTVRTRKG